MQCLQLTRGEPPVTTVDVALSGTFDSSYGYVTIDGTQYTSAQTLKVAKGTSVTVHCGVYMYNEGSEKGSTIKLNGTIVAEGRPSVAAEYTFDVTDNCSIVLSKKSGFTAYYSADITMPA